MKQGWEKQWLWGNGGGWGVVTPAKGEESQVKMKGKLLTKVSASE